MQFSNIEITKCFIAISLLLLSSVFIGSFFQRKGMPKVVGELFGGLLLGPTILGYFFPDLQVWIFNGFEGEDKIIMMFNWIGVVFLMFTSGLEIPRTYSKEDKRLVLFLVIGSTSPFIIGWLAPNFWDLSSFLGSAKNVNALKIIIGIATAITSIPVISKIFIDLNIMGSRFAKVVIATAAIHDIILWVALAIATQMVSEISTKRILFTTVSTILFLGGALIVMPKLIKLIKLSKVNWLAKNVSTSYALVVCFIISTLASLLNINLVFGALIAGILLKCIIPEKELVALSSNVKEISFSFFVPLYFATVGLKLDLIYQFDLLLFVKFLFFITFFETIGTLLAIKLIVKRWSYGFNLAVAMNTRGGPAIVLATVAYNVGIISMTFFIILVMIAIITSLLAGIWFKVIIDRNLGLLN